jgi:hypothetical protein
MKLTLSETIHRIKGLMSLNEGEVNFDANEKKIIDDFVNYSIQDLGIKNKDINIKLQDNKEGIQTTAAYHYKQGGEENRPEESEIKVLCFGRALIDILRSIAHELTHHRQYENGELEGADISSSSPVEKEASAEAGRITKDFLQKNKDKYPELLQSSEELSEDGEAETSSDDSSSTSSDGGSTGSTSNVTKWETGLTRGPANQLTITVWSNNISRGPSNTLDNSVWDTGINRGKANTLF